MSEAGRMRWWGWGVDADAIELPAAATALLADELDVDPAARTGRVELAAVRVPSSALSDAGRAALVAVVGEDGVDASHAARVIHAAGRSYPDLLRLRSGELGVAPDAVVTPSERAQLAPLLEACARHRIAVVPFGGGTSVVGGVDALRGGQDAAIVLDLRRLSRLVDVDTTSLTATVEPGMLGPELERQLAAHGVTLGHFPQSFEYSTVGGWVATRSAGQASSGYGRIDELVEAVAAVTPAGPIETLLTPASAAGPSLRELLVGSEGVLGVIERATLRVRPTPVERRYEGWALPTFEGGAEALRALAQADALPDVARLSDRDETRLTLALGSTGSLGERLGRGYLRLRGRSEGCLAFTGFEGTRDDVARRRGRAAAILRAHGAVALGARPGRSWLRGRFAGPYLRDALLDRAVMVDTLETATDWSNLGALYDAVGGALRQTLSGRGTPPAVMCHISHVYRSGASLYFTFIAAQERGAELDQWRAAKRAASDAIVAAGGTITHHHAVGRDHREWIGAEVGPLGVELLRAVKARVDPTGIMNPEKLIP